MPPRYKVLFPHEGEQKRVQRGHGLSILRDIPKGTVRTLEQPAPPALSRGSGWRPPAVPSGQNYPVVLQRNFWFSGKHPYSPTFLYSSSVVSNLLGLHTLSSSQHFHRCLSVKMISSKLEPFGERGEVIMHQALVNCRFPAHFYVPSHNLTHIKFKHCCIASISILLGEFFVSAVLPIYLKEKPESLFTANMSNSFFLW